MGSRRKVVLGGVGLCMVLSVGFPAQSRGNDSADQPTAARNQAIDADFHVDTFGVAAGQPINSGFVFVDGVYLDAPYTVTRRGSGILVNDEVIVQPLPEWPLPTPEPLPTENPKVPPSLERTTPHQHPDVLGYIRTKLAYIKANYPETELSTRFSEALESLPCVERVKGGTPTTVTVEWTDGDVTSIRIVPPARASLPMDENSIRGRLDGERARLEKKLAKGKGVFYFSDGGEINVSKNRIEERLPILFDILASDQSTEKKFQAVRETMGWQVVKKDGYGSTLVTHFKSSPQLEARIAELRRKNGPPE